MVSIQTSLNPSGGLVYHLRALRYANRQWRPFRRTLESWLTRHFNPEDERCLLVGPSAGYCLPNTFLARFKHLVVLEPDTLARYLLRRRCARLGTSVEFHERDLLLSPLLSGLAGLPELLREYPGLPVVFCNVLGQIRFLISEAEFEIWKSNFQIRVLPALQQRSWLSFHDRVSGCIAPTALASSDHALHNTEILTQFYSGVPARGAELLDHLTYALFPRELRRDYCVWQLEKQSYHLVEIVTSST